MTVRQVSKDPLDPCARKRGYKKRGGGAAKVEFDEAIVPSPARGADLVALDEAIEELAKLDPRKAKVIELRFFGGLAPEETAEVLRVSAVTVYRDRRLAKVWLYRELKAEAKE